jgi:hypothetical protein
MKFDSRTLNILKNFSSINPSIMFTPGNTLATISPTKTVMARATIAENVPSPFGIYDLSKFLGTISMFDSPELDIQENHMTISEKGSKCHYTFTDPSLIVIPPSKQITLPNPEVNFTLAAEDLQKVQRALGVLSLPEIAVVGDGTYISLKAIDTKGASNDDFGVRVGETSNVFKMVFRSENIKVMSETYNVSISSKGLSHFKGNDVEYYIAVESSSTFEG